MDFSMYLYNKIYNKIKYIRRKRYEIYSQKTHKYWIFIFVALTVNESGQKKKKSIKCHVDSYLEREYAAWKNNDFCGGVQEKKADN